MTTWHFTHSVVKLGTLYVASRETLVAPLTLGMMAITFVITNDINHFHLSHLGVCEYNYSDWFINCNRSLRAFSRTKSSAVFSMCIRIFFPVITLLFVTDPFSPLQEEDEEESSEGSYLCRFFCRDRSRCFLDCLFFSLLACFRWRSSFLLLLFDRLFFFCFFDLFRSRSFETDRLLWDLSPFSLDLDLEWRFRCGDGVEEEYDGERSLARLATLSSVSG